jgi:hypothetical protein
VFLTNSDGDIILKSGEWVLPGTECTFSGQRLVDL